MTNITQYGAFTVQTAAAINSNFNQLIPTQGNTYWVRPKNGNDANDGLSPQTAVASLSQAYNLAQPNQNDTIYLCAEGNSATFTTSRVTSASSTFVWAKDLVHLIGVNDGPMVGQRSRIAFVSTFDAAVNLFTISANGCYFSNVEWFAGVAGTLPTGCLKVTGQRNRFVNCNIAGIGNDANDIADAYSLFLDGAAENVFQGCAIGLDTIARGTAANSEILIDSAATRNLFDGCLIYAMLEHATNHPLVKLVDATAIDRWLWFKNCYFGNLSVNYAIAQAGNFKLVQALTQGFIWLDNPRGNPSDNSTVVKWDVDDRNQIALFNAPTPAADTAGMARMV